MRSKTPITAILVGSKPNPSWQGKLETCLLEHGIQIRNVWRNKGDPDHRAQADLIVVTSDCCSHTLFSAAKNAAAISGIRLIVVTHRRSATVPVLEKMGFPRLSSGKDDSEAAIGDDTPDPDSDPDSDPDLTPRS